MRQQHWWFWNVKGVEFPRKRPDRCCNHSQSWCVVFRIKVSTCRHDIHLIIWTLYESSKHFQIRESVAKTLWMALMTNCWGFSDFKTQRCEYFKRTRACRGQSENYHSMHHWPGLVCSFTRHPNQSRWWQYPCAALVGRIYIVIETSQELRMLSRSLSVY